MNHCVFRKLSLLMLSLTLLAACSGPAAPVGGSPTAQEVPANGDPARPAGWDEATHGEIADPNYAVVFPTDKVNQLTITISPESWEAMQADMTNLFGEPGSRGEPGAGGGPGGFPGAGGVMTDTAGFPRPGGGRPNGADGMPFPGGVMTDTAGLPRPGGGRPNGAGGMPFPGGVMTDTAGLPRPGGGRPNGAGGMFTSDNPMWVTATVQFNGQTWTNVGVRYKGNSSLRSAWNSETDKLPFKLDFDEFENDYPAIENQRFYGFKQLLLASNFGDPTGLRETIAYDLLAAAGLPAAETAAYEIILDHGEGLQSLGLYTMVEAIDDTVIDRVFGDDTGNIYEGDGQAASLAAGSTPDQRAASFQKENNSTAADWSDIEALFTVLHDPVRTTDPAAWRAKLEAIFDVPVFLTWLGASAMLEHWDTYGGMPHNFYLYNNPATGKLTWISWDHNLVLGSSIGGGGGRAGGQGGPPAGQNSQGEQNGRGMPGGMGRNVTFDRSTVDDRWPLIRYLLDDPTYYAAYIAALRETSTTVFTSDDLVQRYTALADVLGPVAAKETSQAEYDAAVATLMERLRTRDMDVTTFLATQ